MKNRKNDRSDASLQVDHLGDVHGSRSGARPPIREAITKNVYISPGSGSLVGDKNTQSVVYYLKKTFFRHGRNTHEPIAFAPGP